LSSKDTYRTIAKAGNEVLFKDRNSKFYGHALPINSEEDVKAHIEALKKQHHTARHWCYAYQLGVSSITYRANDDGEPNNSAGMPIYGQIQSFEVTNILVVIVRYFGGTKLGVGGLINAYKTSAKMALEASPILEKTINKLIKIECAYDELNKVMRIVKDKKLKIANQEMHLNCTLYIEVRLKNAEAIFNQLKLLHKIKVQFIDT